MANSLIPFKSDFGSFSDLRNEMDQLFERFFGGSDGGSISQQSAWAPRLDLAQTDNAYEVSVELPGMNADDINVELQHGDLWITGEQKRESEEHGKTWHRGERCRGQFRRVVRLGDDVDPEHVEAEYRDGVLHISVKKTEAAQTKKISIKH